MITQMTPSEDVDDRTVGEYIKACAAQIKSEIISFGDNWKDQSDKDRLIAASACPKALEAELSIQINNAKAHISTEYACKAKSKTAQATPASKDVISTAKKQAPIEKKPPSF